MNKENNIEQHAIHATLAIIALALGLILFSGCSPSLEKATKVATKNEANAQHTQTAITAKFKYLTATHCDDVFPVAESEVTKGAETITESEETTTETLPCKDAEGKPTEYVEVPKVRTVTKTIYRTDTIRVRSTAAEYALQATINKGKAELAAEQEAHAVTQNKLADVKKHRLILGILLGITWMGLIGMAVIRFYLRRP